MRAETGRSVIHADRCLAAGRPPLPPMNARLRKLAGDLADTFWLLPALLVAAMIALALALVEFDRSGLAPRWLIEGRRSASPARCSQSPSRPCHSRRGRWDRACCATSCAIAATRRRWGCSWAPSPTRSPCCAASARARRASSSRTCRSASASPSRSCAWACWCSSSATPRGGSTSTR